MFWEIRKPRYIPFDEQNAAGFVLKSAAWKDIIIYVDGFDEMYTALMAEK